MKTEKININLPTGSTPGAYEFIFRETTKVNELEIKEPVKVQLSGVIGVPFEFLSKRHDQPEQVNQKKTHIKVNRSNICITLVINEDDPYLRGVITGKLEYHPKFQEFGINSEKKWSPTTLGMFFKMNRSFFKSIDENMKLVHDLMNFTATVNNVIDRSVKESGDRTDKFEQLVNSNLPKAFNLILPIFKGLPNVNIEVETFATINGKEVSFTLLSPGAQSYMEEIRDRVIDDQIKAITAICPDIAIIEE